MIKNFKELTIIDQLNKKNQIIINRIKNSKVFKNWIVELYIFFSRGAYFLALDIDYWIHKLFFPLNSEKSYDLKKEVCSFLNAPNGGIIYIFFLLLIY